MDIRVQKNRGAVNSGNLNNLRTRFQEVIDYLPSGVSLIDKELNLVIWNRELLRLLGFPAALFADKAPNMETLLRYNAERGDYGPGNPEDQVRAGLERARLMQPHNFERIRPDGTILEIRGEPLPDGGFVTIYTDITQRKQTEHKYAAILENASIGILFTRDRKVLHCNPNLAHIFGWASAEELFGKPGSVFWPTPEDYLEIGRIAGPILASGKVFEAERQVIRRDGRHFPAHVVAKAVNPDAATEGTIWIIQDITERYAAEAERQHFITEMADRTMALERVNAELRDALAQLSKTQTILVRSEKLAALGSLVAGVAHEINTPLGNALMLTTIMDDHLRKLDLARQGGVLKQSDIDAIAEDMIESNDHLLRNLRRSVELIRHFKQTAADQTSGWRRCFDLQVVIGDIHATLSGRIRQAGHALSVDCPASLSMDSYPGAVGQIITNLVENAILHAFDQHIQGVMILKVQAAGDSELTMTFSDNGRGISREHLPRVFDPFFTTRLGQGGSGLGLYIVHNIVTDVLGGQVSVSSQIGVGTQFDIVLPRVAPHRDNSLGAGQLSRAGGD